MKHTFNIITALFLLASTCLAVSPETNENWKRYRSAEMQGGQASIFYYAGEDTIGPLEAGTGGEMSTGILQMQWTPDDAGTYPNMTLSDTLVNHDPQFFDLWVQLDSSSLGGYGDYDSLGFASITARFYYDVTDTVFGWLADSTNLVAYDSAYTHTMYGQWVYEDRKDVIANCRDKWLIHHVRVPMCAGVEFIIKAHGDAVLECTRVKWIFVCKH